MGDEFAIVTQPFHLRVGNLRRSAKRNLLIGGHERAVEDSHALFNVTSSPRAYPKGTWGGGVSGMLE